MNRHLPSRRRSALLAVALLLCVGVAATVGPVWSKSAKTNKSRSFSGLVKIVKGPPARTRSKDAVFRFKTKRRTKTWCRRDDQRYRRCRGGLKYVGLRPGRHVFRVRARRGKQTRFVSRRWTVKKTGKTTRGPVGEAARPSAVAPAGGMRTIDPRTPVGGSAGRRLVFSDEFNGTLLDTSAWRLYHSPGHAGNGLRRPSAFALDGLGHLVLTAQMVNDQIVSGGMANRLEFTYGRLEFRVMAEPDPTGTMSAVVLTWPQRQWSPEFTENDIYETGARVNNRSEFQSYIHFGTANWQKWTTHHVDPSRWHTIAMEWGPDQLDVEIDGQLAWSISDPAVIPDVLHHVTIQLDARATRPLTQPVRMWVDYVRLFQ